MIRALAFLLFIASPAAAQDRVSILIGSHHTEDYAWEEVNPGLFLTWEGPVDLSAGIYRNSFGRPSAALTAALPVIRWQDGGLSLLGGAAYYPGNGDNFAVHAGDLVPLVGLQARHGNVFAQIMPGKVEPPEVIIAYGLTFAIGR